jgi:hypothetical protein
MQRRTILGAVLVFGALAAIGCGSQSGSQSGSHSGSQGGANQPAEKDSGVTGGGFDAGAPSSDDAMAPAGDGASAPGMDAALAGDAGTLANCTQMLAPPRKTTSTTVSNMAIDYTLVGPPAATHHKVLLLMFNASSKTASTPDVQYARGFYTPTQLGDTFFNDPDGVHAFMSEASYGGVSFSGRVVGWINLPATTMAATTIQQNYNMYAEMATAYANFADYDIVYFVFLTDGTDGLQVGWNQTNTVQVSQGTFTVGIDFMINSFFFLQAGSPAYYSVILPSRSWAHELVHTFGSVGHDLSLDCGQSVIAASCAIQPYGDPFSLMGESAFGNHPTINVKNHLGWLAASRLTTVGKSGDFTICPSETVDSGNKGLVIPLKTPISLMSTTGNATTTFDRIMVEYRRPFGFDRYLDRLQSNWLAPFKTDGPVREDGVLVTLGYQDTSTNATVLLDMHPTSSYVSTAGIEEAGNVGKFSDAMLYVGESYQFAGQSITLATKSLTSDGGIIVHVDY